MDEGICQRVLDLAVEIQQVPAPTFQEAQRAALVRERFIAEGLSEVSQDALGNVFGLLPGDSQTANGRRVPPLIVSAHLDTVFPDLDMLPVKRAGNKIHGPGIGDNSLGVAGLFGLLWSLRRRAGGDTGGTRSGKGTASSSAGTAPGSDGLPGDIWLVANVGEEGLGDLSGMRAVVDRFGRRVQGYLVVEGMALGHVYHRGLGVQRYRITLRTAGGHSWANHGQPSAIHELAGLVTRLTALPLPTDPRTTLNVGMIAGGTSVNSIAAEAHLELDLRSERMDALRALADRVETLVKEINRPDVQASARVVGRRPAGHIAPDHPLVQLAARSLEDLGHKPVINVGSTDANVPLSRGIPAICIGLTTGCGAHTREEYIHTRPLAIGLAQLVRVVEEAHTVI